MGDTRGISGSRLPDMEEKEKSDTEILIRAASQSAKRQQRTQLHTMQPTTLAAPADEIPHHLPTKRQYKRQRSKSLRQSAVSSEENSPLPDVHDEATTVNQGNVPGSGSVMKKYESSLPMEGNGSMTSSGSLTHGLYRRPEPIFSGSGKPNSSSTVVAAVSSKTAGLQSRPTAVVRNALSSGHGKEDYFEMEPPLTQTAAYKRSSKETSPAESPDVSSPSNDERPSASTAKRGKSGGSGHSGTLVGGLAIAAEKAIGTAAHGAKLLWSNVGKLHPKKSDNGDKENDGNNLALAEDEEAQSKEEVLVHVREQERHATRREFGFVMTPEKKNQLISFVTSNICCCECSTYIPAPKRESNAKSEEVNQPCCCGRPYSWHEQNGCHLLKDQGPESGSISWSSSKHTREILTPAFGRISFIGFTGGDRRYLAPYVRVSTKTSPKVVWELLSKHWDLPGPKLLLSVTGGAKRFFTKNRETQIFKKEFIDAVKATGAWVLTCGLGAGVMQYVGQAVHEYAATVGSVERHKLVLLGVSPWGGVDNRSMLVGEKGAGLFPARYDASKLQNQSGTAALDNNHTHFIFVDNGTEGQFGSEIEWRANFEKYISMHIRTGIDKEQSIQVPVVQLLINGGPNSIETAAEAIENGTPLIIVDGTKRAAELLAAAYKLSASITDWKSSKVVQPLIDKLTPLMERTINSTSEKDMQRVLQIVERRELVTLFTLDSLVGEKTLDRVILQALMKANKTDPRSQLSLALAWNKPDFARTEILTSAENYRALSGEHLHDALFRSLINDQHQFVQLFLDCGVDLRKFLTMQRLSDLYKEVLNMKDQDTQSELIQVLIDREHNPNERKDSIPLLEKVGRVITMLIGNYYPNDYKGRRHHKQSDDTGPSAEASVNVLMAEENDDLATEDFRGARRKKNRHQRSDRSLRCPEKHLMLWALLFNRHELATMFWKAGINHMSTALISARISGKLSRIADNEDKDDLIVGYQQLTAVFEVLASQVLAECYDKNKQLTYVCLTRKVNELGDTTAMSVAEDAEHEDFMQHLSCQLKLSRIWKGNMVMYTPEWKLILTAVMPFLFVPLLQFVRKSPDQQRVDEKEFDDLAQLQQVDSAAFVSGSGSGAKADSRGQHNGTMHFVEVGPPVEELQDRQQHSKYFSVSLTGSGPHKIGYIRALQYFVTAPVTKFIYNVFSYMSFLVLFSIFVICELAPVKDVFEVKVFEILTWIWCASLIMEEMRQVMARTGTSFAYNIERWWSNDWNKMDLAMYLLFMLALGLRFHLPPETFIWARMAYVVSMSLFVIRCTQMFFVYKQIGPKIIMIRRMLKDLFFFLFILSVFLFCFGIAYRALLYPNSELNGSLLANIIYHPYFIIFGQSPMDEIYSGTVEGCVGNVSSVFGSGDACPSTNWLAQTYLALYSLVANVLLINLLIAMFSFTFQSVQEHSERLWKYNRYSLIYEFFDRPALPCPVIVFSHIYRFGALIRSLVTGKTESSADDFQIRLSKEENQRIVSFERVAMESYMTKVSREEKNNITNKVHTTSERMEKVLEDIDDIKENLTQMFAEAKDRDSQIVGGAPIGPNPLTGYDGMLQTSRLTADSLVAGTLADGQQLDRPEERSALRRMQEDIATLGHRLAAVENTLQRSFDTLSGQLSLQMEAVLQIVSRTDVGGRAAVTSGASTVTLTPIDPSLSQIYSSVKPK